MAQVTHGYPDFGRYQAQSDVLFLHESNIVINAAVDKPLGFVGQLPYMGITFQGLVGAFDILFAFYADSAYNTLLTVFAFDVNAGGVFGGSVPVGGPFCQVTLTPSGAGAKYSADIWSAPAEFGAYVALPTDNMLIFEKARSVAAGANFQWDSNRTFPGAVHLSIHTTAAVWTAELYGVDYTGATKFVLFHDSGGANYGEDFNFPALPARLIVHNGDGASRFFDVSLIAHPWSPAR